MDPRLTCAVLAGAKTVLEVSAVHWQSEQLGVKYLSLEQTERMSLRSDGRKMKLGDEAVKVVGSVAN